MARLAPKKVQKSAGIASQVGNHTFRATGVTAYVKNGGTLGADGELCLDAHHAALRPPRVTLDEVERILV
jgi:hypothetical protein